MKKAIFTLTVAALALASSFAAEPKVLLNARLRANFVTIDLDDDENNSGAVLGSIDYFGVEYRDEHAGAKISLKGALSGLTSVATDVTTTTTTDADGDVTAVTTTVNKANVNGITIDDYWGWLLFGPFKVSGGEWEHRFADRVTADGNQFGGLWDLKYGPLAFNAASEGFVTAFSEADNITPWTTSEIAGDYSADGLSVSASTGTSSGDPYSVTEFFGARVGYALADKAIVSASVIRNGENKLTAGAYGKLIAVENLTAVAGFSAYRDSDADENSLNAVELRARYVVGALSFTTHNNATFGEDRVILYNLVNVAYKLNENLTPALLVARSSFSGDAASWEGSALIVRPGISVFSQKNASIDAGVALTFVTPKDGDATKVVTLPVVLRVIY